MSETYKYWVRRLEIVQNEAGKTDAVEDPERIAIKPATMLSIGRQMDSAIPIPDTDENVEVSRQQAVLLAAQGALHLFHLGLNPTFVNGVVVPERSLLKAGDCIQFHQSPVAFRVESEETTQRARVATVTWRIDMDDRQEGEEQEPTPSRPVCVIDRSPFFVGGGPEDHLQLVECPRNALKFELVQDDLFMTAQAAAKKNGMRLEAGYQVRVEHTDFITMEGRVLRLMALSGGKDGTTRLRNGSHGGEVLPHQVLLDYEDEGGDLTIAVGEIVAEVEVSGREARYMHALLEPRTVYRDRYVDNEEIVVRVWIEVNLPPGELKNVKHYVRKLLEAEGLSEVDEYLQIKRGRGQTRFRVIPGADVRVSPPKKKS